MKEDRKDKN